MKPRLSDGVAFVIGVIIAMVASGFVETGPVFIAMTLRFLWPGFFLGNPLAALLLPQGMGLEGIGLMIIILALVNGLLYALAWYLGRIAAQGSRVALLVVVLALGCWSVVFARWSAENWPKPEPPLMPVDLASPLAGRWEGVIHAARGEPPVIFVLQPRTDGTLDGFFYVAGQFSGPFYRGRLVGDSVYFDEGSFHHRGHRDGVQLTIDSPPSGSNQTMELRFVSPDTTRLKLPPLSPE